MGRMHNAMRSEWNGRGEALGQERACGPQASHANEVRLGRMLFKGAISNERARVRALRFGAAGCVGGPRGKAPGEEASLRSASESRERSETWPHAFQRSRVERVSV